MERLRRDESLALYNVLFGFLLPLSTIADHSEAFNCWAAEEKRSDPRLPCNEERLLARRSGGLVVSHVFVSSSHLVFAFGGQSSDVLPEVSNDPGFFVMTCSCSSGGLHVNGLQHLVVTDLDKSIYSMDSCNHKLNTHSRDQVMAGPLQAAP